MLFKIKFSSVTFITSLETLKNAGWPFWNLAIIPLQSEHAYLYNQQNDLPRSEIKLRKKIQAWTGAEPLTAVIPVQCFINWANINQLANKPTHVYFFCVYYTHVMVTMQLSVLKQDIRYKRKVKNLNYCLTWPLFSDQNSYSVGQRVY